jgi:DNA-binding CsgD family transcriptional regulator
LFAATSFLRVEKTINRGNDWRAGGVALPTATGLFGLIEMLQGRSTEAKTLADRALEELLAGGASAGSADFAVWCIACVNEALGDVTTARDLLVGIWELVARDASLFTIAPDLVRLTRDERPEFALDVVQRTETRAAGSGAAFDRANALASRGLYEQDPMLLERACLAWDELDWTLPQARMRTFATDMAATECNPAELSVHVERAMSAWERMEATHPVTVLQQRHRRIVARGSRPAKPTSGPESLSQAERTVVALVAEGITNKEIAQRLYVSHRTVDSHVSHALAKLGLTSRVQLASFAVSQHA